jgi:hypothetical protein
VTLRWALELLTTPGAAGLSAWLDGELAATAATDPELRLRRMADRLACTMR